MPPLRRRYDGNEPPVPDELNPDGLDLDQRLSAVQDTLPRRKKGNRTLEAMLALGAVAGVVALARHGGGPVLAGIGAGARSLEDSADRERKQNLEDLIFQERIADRKRREKSQTIEDAVHQSQIGENNARADYYRRPPKAGTSSYQRFQGADGQWYVFDKNNPDDVHALDDESGNAIKGPLSRGGTRAPNANAESPVVRDNRRAATRDHQALDQTSREINAAKRELGKYPTHADSASGKVRSLDALVARRDSLKGEYDRHSSAANAAALGGASGDATDLQQELVRARQAYDATLAQPGVDSASAKALYDRVVRAIRAKHSSR